ncbi:MAG: hypothetical protein NT007_04545 [Candidatus Kapabacteria bacterium]|nr:hypothetical protein [Candidatus Kapabacteria bacterium]
MYAKLLNKTGKIEPVIVIFSDLINCLKEVKLLNEKISCSELPKRPAKKCIFSKWRYING